MSPARAASALEDLVRSLPRRVSPERVAGWRARFHCTFSGADKAFGQSWEHWVKRWERARELLEQGLDPGEYEPQPEELDS